MTYQSALSPSRARTRALAVALVALLLAALLPGAVAQAKPGNACDRRNNNTYQKLLECLTAEGGLQHLEQFQKFADNNDDTRASGTPGYDMSADYVAELMEDAGYEVTRQEFDAPFFEVLLSSLTIDGQELEPFDLTTGEGDYYVFDFSGDGNVTNGDLIPATNNVVPIGDAAANTSDAGCESEDYEPAPDTQAVALVQRGTCSFAQKALNAQEAGYDGVLVFNEGQPGRDGVVLGTLGGDALGVITIPVAGISYEFGALLNDGTATVDDFTVDGFGEIRTTENVIAESPGGNADNVVMAGAHLDSVPDGPGIHDNGSGSAAILEVALALSKLDPVNKLRFAWWGAEESGLIGSTLYVNTLPDDELEDIAAYLNFDMVASPNFIYGVYDADQSSFEASAPVPDGSAAIEDLFEIYFTWQDVPYEDTEFSGRSDYQAFILSGIPSSGLFTGAEVAKTDEQEAIWDGVAGASYDPCYHQACDSLESDEEAERPAEIYDELNAEYTMVGNVNLDALETNTDAIGFAMLTLAYSTEDVNGVVGRTVPGSRALNLPDEPAGPEGTVGTQAGGGHSHGES
jgi:Zn-dependent M28 family amino/carboxypeptidase